MPTYQYRCKECDHELEVVQSFTDEPLAECPACGGALRKVYGSVGISFKGSGFYKTDSRTGSGSKAKKAATGDASTSGTDSPTPSTPAEKAPAAASTTSTTSSSD